MARRWKLVAVGLAVLVLAAGVSAATVLEMNQGPPLPRQESLVSAPTPPEHRGIAQRVGDWLANGLGGVAFVTTLQSYSGYTDMYPTVPDSAVWSEFRGVILAPRAPFVLDFAGGMVGIPGGDCYSVHAQLEPGDADYLSLEPTELAPAQQAAILGVLPTLLDAVGASGTLDGAWASHEATITTNGGGLTMLDARGEPGTDPHMGVLFSPDVRPVYCNYSSGK